MFVYSALPLVAIISLVDAGQEKSGTSMTIGCFTCHSFNNSDPGCQDPFNPDMSVYTNKCEQGRNGRIGLFPAHYCIKMSGVGIVTGIELTVRTCALKNMHNQCGTFEFEDIPYHGCVTTCEKNGCNHGNSIAKASLWRLIIVLLLSIVSA
ncbi:hypothetical protein LSH36_18g11044 [Paralvinella palmiformis]|uniref:Protein sleepless n=1 Tax=Paralvinella palmiformis TaxID=53620 RepID=A0AAD9KBK4_9ANNE|nr:hypothetical protein LSH36_18g11044 [Paralvinella palmiformis]